MCYIRKAFLLVRDLLEDTISFKDNTSNANALSNLQELSVRLNDCFPKINDKEQDEVGGAWSPVSGLPCGCGGPLPAHTPRVHVLPHPASHCWLALSFLSSFPSPLPRTSGAARAMLGLDQCLPEQELPGSQLHRACPEKRLVATKHTIA